MSFHDQSPWWNSCAAETNNAWLVFTNSQENIRVSTEEVENLVRSSSGTGQQ